MSDKVKQIKHRGNIAIATAYCWISSYVVYFIVYSVYNYRLDEVYFIVNTATISIFAYLLFLYFENVNAKAAMLFTSIFAGGLVLSYVGNWLILGRPYAWITVSLIIGFMAGLFYHIFKNGTKHHKRRLYH